MKWRLRDTTMQKYYSDAGRLYRCGLLFILGFMAMSLAVIFMTRRKEGYDHAGFLCE